jgi:hypothetical protein
VSDTPTVASSRSPAIAKAGSGSGGGSSNGNHQLMSLPSTPTTALSSSREAARAMRTVNRRSLPAQLDLRSALRRQEAEIAAATSEHKEQRPAPRRAAPSANKTTTARPTQVKAPRGRRSSPSGGKQDSAPIDTERSDQSPAPRGTTTTEGTASLRASTRTLEGDESAGGTGTGTGNGGGGLLQEDNPMSHVLREREERRRFVEEDDDECDLVRDLLVRPEWQAALWHPDSPTAAPEGSGRAAAAVARPPLRRVLSLGSLSPSSPGGATAEAASFFSYRPTKVTLDTSTHQSPIYDVSARHRPRTQWPSHSPLPCMWWLVVGVDAGRCHRRGAGARDPGNGYRRPHPPLSRGDLRVAQSGLECSPPFSPFRPLLPPHSKPAAPPSHRMCTRGPGFCKTLLDIPRNFQRYSCPPPPMHK